MKLLIKIKRYTNILNVFSGMRFIHSSMFAIVVMFLISSCGTSQEDITIYSLVDHHKFIKKIVSQYNATQKKFKVRYRQITDINLRDVLENTINRENLFLLLSSHFITERAGEEYLANLLPEFDGDVRRSRINYIGRSAIEYSRGLGTPLFSYDLENEEGVQVATLSIPKVINTQDFLEQILDFFQFISQREVNAQALIYGHIPMYTDASIELLTSQEIDTVHKQEFPDGKFFSTMQPQNDSFVIAK